MKLFLAVVSLIVLIVLLVAPAAAQAPDWVQPAIDVAKSPAKDAQARVDAVAKLTDGWKDSLPVLIQNIDAYYRSDVGAPYTQDDVASLLPLTDIVVTIVLNKDGAIQAFRDADTDKTIKILTWATRGDPTVEQSRNLRFNASYILASVVDNSNLCIVLDHLRDPKLGPVGMTNLLQVATGAASYAYKENADATLTTVDILKPKVAQGGLGKTAILVQSLAGSASMSPNAETPLPSDAAYCRDYDYDTTPP
jgi:hypothetical protein